jgi:hypothetical protein
VEFQLRSISAAIQNFDQFKTPLNIEAILMCSRKFTAHTTLGLSYLLIGYRGLVTVGMLVSIYLFLNLKKLKKLDID